MRITRDIRAILAGALVFVILAIAFALLAYLISSLPAASLYAQWPVAVLGILAPLASGAVCGYLAQRHDLLAVLALGVIDSCVMVALGAVGDHLGISRDHIGALWEIAGVVILCVPLVIVGGAAGGKLRDSRYA